MILIGSNDKETKSSSMGLDPASQQMRNWDRVIGNRLNLGGFFKKLPVAIGGRRDSSSMLEPIREGGDADPVAEVGDEGARPEENTSGEVNTLGSVAIESPNNYTYMTDHAQERYTSFTAECISLQNSDMTQMGSDDQSERGVAVSKLGLTEAGVMHGSISSTLDKAPDLIPRKKTLRSILKNGFHNNEASEGNFALEEYDDLATCLSESESDLNFNPHLEENANDYKIGGYHPVSKGEVYYSESITGREYIILRKLGWGHFSTVWLAKARFNPSLTNSIDHKEKIDEKESYVAIKFVKSSKNYAEAAEDEIKILKCLSDPLRNGDHLSEHERKHFDRFRKGGTGNIEHDGAEHTLRMIDDFTVNGPNGAHICMVFEVLGENVLNLLYNCKNYFYTLNKEVSTTSNASDSSVMSALKFNKKEMIPPKKKTISKLSAGLSLRNQSKVGNSSDEENSSKNVLVSNSLNTTKKKCFSGIPLSWVRQMTKQMLLAIDYMHHCGIIHTDLKPENILVDIKDVTNIIKSMEEQQIAKMKEFNREKVKEPFSIARQPSVNSYQSISGSYRRSKNSITGKYDTPVRTSKPLCCSLNSEISFRDVQFSESKSAAKSLPKNTSPKTRSFGFLRKSNNDNNNNAAHDISIKIADFGNATYSNFHFTNQIQTRQYRSPEIILKHKTWGASTDIWSVGCLIFELITGDFLFDPHDGSSFDKDEDHLAQMLELLGDFPSEEFLINCKLTSKFFKLNDEGKLSLKNIEKLKYWSLEDVFVEKYKFDKDDSEVKLITDLIMKCLRFNLHERYDAGSLLAHPWLQEKDCYSEMDSEQASLMPNNNFGVPGFIS